jgi:hypothetical protein
MRLELALGSHRQTVRFIIPVKGVLKNARYGAELRDGDGKIVWRQDLLPPRPSNKFLNFSVQAGIFKRDDYTFKLNFITPSGIDLSREYKITVTQK